MSSDCAENHYGVCPRADYHKNLRALHISNLSEFCAILMYVKYCKTLKNVLSGGR